MATSYTNTLQLAKQGAGENANTWGTILNDNVIDMVDNAFSTNIAGSIDFSTATTITLSQNNGLADQSRLTVLGLTGTRSDATSIVDLIVPTFTTANQGNGVTWAGKMYIVRNPNTFTVRVKNAGNTGTNIPKQATMGILATPTTVVPLFAGFYCASAGDSTTNVNSSFLANVSIGTTAGNSSFNFGRITQSSISATSFNNGLITNLSATGPASMAGHTTFASVATFSGDVSVNGRSMCAMTTIKCSATTTIDLATSNFFYVKASGAISGAVSISLAKPVNGVVGQTGAIYMVNGTSSGSSTFNFQTSAWKFPAGITPSKTAAADSVDLLTYFVRDVSSNGALNAIDVAVLNNFKS